MPRTKQNNPKNLKGELASVTAVRSPLVVVVGLGGVVWIISSLRVLKYLEVEFGLRAGGLLSLSWWEEVILP